mgnify:FL=1
MSDFKRPFRENKAGSSASKPTNGPPGERRFTRPERPPIRRETTTLWDYPSQNYGAGKQGDTRYLGATPSYVIWNCIERYTKPGDLVVDPFCGSGTTLDVAKDLGRVARGFDLKPYRPDVEKADARKIPVASGTAKLVFMDPPYGDHIDYSDDPSCIGKISAYDERFYVELGKVVKEAARVLMPGSVLGVYICDYFEKKRGFAPVGMGVYAQMLTVVEPLDVIAVTRHHKTLEQGNFHKAADEQGFFLRGFNYLFLGTKR